MAHEKKKPAGTPVSRRHVLRTGAAVASATTLSGVIAQQAAAQGQLQPPLPPALPPPAPQATLKVALRLNGRAVSLDVDPRTTLLDALRENLSMTGTKKGCDHGQCGACTVLVNNRRINSCLSLAVMHEGDQVTTIEGFARPAPADGEQVLHPMQAAFLKHDGFQCGYCTPGQICSAAGMLAELRSGMPSHVTANLLAPAPLTEEEIRERMSGNLCRCSCYPRIVSAIQEAAGAPA